VVKNVREYQFYCSKTAEKEVERLPENTAHVGEMHL